MLHLIQSNRMEVLVDSLCGQLKEASGLGVFESTDILVQSPGMAKWLESQVAGALGIAANLNFPLPSSYIWRCYQQLIEDLPERSAFNKEAMSWKLMGLLPVLLDKSEFQALANYLQDDGENKLKSYQLCHKIADLFDQYLVYRPDWILAWEQGQDSTGDLDVSSQPWQPILWRALVAATADHQESPYHRANLHQQLLNKIAKGAIQGKVLRVFGISAIPKLQLEVLQALGEHNDVWIYWLNPSDGYWGDLVDQKSHAKAQLAQHTGLDYLDVGNPLLSAWGKLGRDFLDMLLDLEPQQVDAFEDVQPDSLLGHIQREILQLTHRGSAEPLVPEELFSNGQDYPKIAIVNDDTSLCVAHCHSKVRELEALHDHLLSRFNQDASLSPADVIVMVPDIAQYAPLIEGVFGSAQGNLHIPYGVSDQSLVQASALIEHFVRLMQLGQSRMTLAEQLDLLQHPAVMAKFDLEEQDLTLLSHWLQSSGVRWGLSGQDKARWDLPEDNQNTLEFGLERLLAGYAMGGELLEAQQRLISPFQQIEGQSAQALGKFVLFVQSLQATLGFCQQQGSIAQKVSEALALIDRWYALDGRSDQDELAANKMREQLTEIAKFERYYAHPISQDIFVQLLKQSLQDKGVSQGFLAGRVNFCTLMPMRSIPFKQVCILGLNDGAYPRQNQPMGFDLMLQSKGRKGDRSRRLDDRYLFLEAILSAREQLYLSFEAYSEKDNSPKVPSLLLQELLTYCQQVYRLADDNLGEPDESQALLLGHISRLHGLQPFAKSYFSAKTLASYQSKWAAVVTAKQKPAMAKPLVVDSAVTESKEVIGLAHWLDFFNNPAKAYFYQRWQLRLPGLADTLQDDEPFSLDGLDKYQLSDAWVQAQLKGVSRTEFVKQITAQGLLPVSVNGQRLLDEVIEQNQGLVARLQPYMQLEGERVEIQLPLSQVLLEGWQQAIRANQLLLWRPGSLRGKDRLNLWLNWLVLSAQAQPLEQGLFLAKDSMLSLNPVPEDIAIDLLFQFETLWLEGQAQPVHWYPETAWQWVKTGDQNKCLSTFIGHDFQKGEGQEAHIARLCPDLSPHLQQLCDYADNIFSPMLDFAEEQKCSL